MAGLYAANGSINVTVVDGSTYTGLYAPDGSWNVVQVDGTTAVGAYHACGALNVFKYVSGQPSARHISGALMVTTTPFVQGATKVNVVSGSLT